MKDFSKYIIYGNQSVQDGLYKLNSLSGSEMLVLFVLGNEERLVGTLTDGDIRRAFLAGKTIKDKISDVMHEKFRYLKKGESDFSKIKELRDKKIDIVPVLDQQGRISKIISLKEKYSMLPLDALIMAGGVGERLRPLTEKTPKPLLKVGDKPIVEHTVDRLIKFGIDRINISIGYLGSQLVDYFGDGEKKEIQVSYISEQKPLGTIGALKLVEHFDHDTILVLNSDVLTNIDLEDFYRKFEEDQALMSVASVPYKVDVPYAVLELEGNQIKSMREKPTYTYFSNAGIYLIRKEIINYIPKDTYFHATDLMDLLIAKGQKVTSYPILGYWLDIGRYDDFIKAQEDIKHIKF